MIPPGADTVLVRYGDIGVKSTKVQRDMEDSLETNLRAMLDSRAVPSEIDWRWSRPRIRTAEVDAAAAVACDTFGIVSASPAVSVEPTMAAICRALSETAGALGVEGPFAVSARRAGEREAHPFTSEDIEREGGQAIWDALSDPAVDLDDPSRTFYVECRSDEAFVFVEKRTGPGGLPLGSQRPLVALLSGGIDSPVAAWELMKRGAPVIPLYFDFEAYGGVDHVARAVESARTLAGYAPNHTRDLRIAPAGAAAARFVEGIGPTRMLSLRRFMLRVGERLARETGAVGIVTGEAIGQKSSQTSANLAVTDAVAELPVHRPLLTRDKQEIIARAREIGTYEDSTVEAGCNRIAPEYPETNASLEAVEAAEPDLDALVEESFAGIDRVGL
ncbi:tRNA sulfurtransferase [Halalkalicoccus jeotgali]|uniref:Probable tRNA sulfurtransferase n=1 Tax=Halalkalicoccus jeotgali (strain DSM 18796 / CECT 7217 / JCM 14584 / KCTC 4019 / B3) TaxID=795797 RepID=D8J2L1_HALJB|nr:tRNA sulfurtransferase [Halalkalicoccus jeotgali]ADJ14968.1 thiamine biosynthesis protein ThiI [Halalkalicoccus jeotgali B3]ELY35016.1 thiamine biosynthesis protein [Halalkalicoccus jeotgali B3]